MWAKVWIGVWLGMALFYAVLACQPRWAKLKAIKSQQSWHLRFSRVADGGGCGSPRKLAAFSDSERPKFRKIFENFDSRNTYSSAHCCFSPLAQHLMLQNI